MLLWVRNVGVQIVHDAVPIAKSVLEAQTLGRRLVESAAVVRTREGILAHRGLEAVVMRITAPNVVNRLLGIDAEVSGIRIAVKTSSRGDLDPDIGDQD